ncbi:dicarboxylate/amino acid:cation symporter [Pelosinus propionicus]|uniref:Proton glutamate symport protein n=1 Tax=Pelosinus propionicus DSM 13327 TaxID=1123291 RepID=A0A1I4NIA6_9FIRM|nr:cation:dicarboxylase symporter family transporter [Pelosinus propionicus]SFM15201.1 proton glutamate symport protein [Pelosinus propionicus DSM 13327]
MKEHLVDANSSDISVTSKKIKSTSPSVILMSLIGGIACGYFFPEFSVTLKPIGDAFIKMIKMIIVPLVFSILVIGIAGTGDFKKMSRLGGKALLWFTFASTIALIIGLVLANVLQPGSGVALMQVAPPEGAASAAKFRSTTELLLSIIPTNIFEALSTANLLQVVFFSCFFGVATAALKERGKPILDFLTAVSEAMFNVTHYVMKVTPFGIFAFMGWSVGKYGLSLVIPLAKLIGTLYLGLVIFVVCILGLACFMLKINMIQVFRVIKEPLILSFSTCSSEAALPILMEKLLKFGVPKHIVSFVLPTGYSFNLDGAAIYKCMALMFIAQVSQIPIDISTQMMMIVAMMIMSKGSAGMPGMAFVQLSAGAAMFNLPMEGLFMIMGVDRLMDMGRTSVNLIGNAIATLIVARWEGELSEETIQQGYAKNYEE